MRMSTRELTTTWLCITGKEETTEPTPLPMSDGRARGSFSRSTSDARDDGVDPLDGSSVNVIMLPSICTSAGRFVAFRAGDALLPRASSSSSETETDDSRTGGDASIFPFLLIRSPALAPVRLLAPIHQNCY